MFMPVLLPGVRSFSGSQLLIMIQDLAVCRVLLFHIRKKKSQVKDLFRKEFHIKVKGAFAFNDPVIMKRKHML